MAYIDACENINDKLAFSASHDHKLETIEKNKLRIAALDKLRSKCAKWYGYLDNLDQGQLEEYKNEINTNKELQMFFIEANKKQDVSAVNLAKSVISTGGDSSDFSKSVLAYLLSMDNDLTLEIGKRMGVRYPLVYVKQIKRDINNITTMYGCAVEPELQCSQNSLGVLFFCSQYGGDICGSSYEDLIAQSTTVNHFSDIQQIVSIIQQLIKEGYFD